jgi:30S ribosomal protein S31
LKCPRFKIANRKWRLNFGHSKCPLKRKLITHEYVIRFSTFATNKKILNMGRGDKRTAKGKRFKKSFGNSRPHKVKKAAASKAAAPKKAKAVKAVKTVTAEKPAAKKAPAKKAAAKKKAE